MIEIIHRNKVNNFILFDLISSVKCQFRKKKTKYQINTNSHNQIHIYIYNRLASAPCALNHSFDSGHLIKFECVTIYMLIVFGFGCDRNTGASVSANKAYCRIDFMRY